MQNAPVAQEQSQSDLAAQIRAQVHQQVQEAQRIAQEARSGAQGGGPVVLVPPAPPAQMDFISPQMYDLGMFFLLIMAVIAIGTPIARALGRRLDRKPFKQALDPGLTSQLQRIENTVESMSIEIERISEAQRYMARLQSERGEPAALPRQQAP